MKDERKTKEQLIDELVELRRRIAGLEESEANRERTEKELLKAKVTIKHLIGSNPAVIYTCKIGGDWPATFVSENIKAQLGYEPWEFLENPSFWINNIHPEDLEYVVSGFEPFLENDYRLSVYRFLHKDGTYRWMRDELRIVRSSDGEPIECIGYWVDITEFKQLVRE